MFCFVKKHLTNNHKEIMHHHRTFPPYFHFQPYKSWEWYQDNFKYDYITGEVLHVDGGFKME